MDEIVDARTAVGLAHDGDDQNSRGALALSPASFWVPDRLLLSAWLEHAPFAFWLIDALRPSLVVELGTHNGFSYLAFCQAVERLNGSARCFAVDTWEGDEHAGFYGEEVFNTLREYHDEKYGAFSRLLRARFDEALEHFSDGTIDLLHIDGRHTYDDVKHDFETWRPKLSADAIVIFHDTNVRERDFGVWKLWEKVKTQYETFEFVHGNGLGVLKIGQPGGDAIRSLFGAAGAVEDYLRGAYASLGASVRRRYIAEQLQLYINQPSATGSKQASAPAKAEAARNAAANALRPTAANIAALQSELAKANLAAVAHGKIILDERQWTQRLKSATDEAAHNANVLRAEADVLEAERSRFAKDLHQRAIEVASLNAAIGRLSTTETSLLSRLSTIETSLSWRLTQPLRTFAVRFPRTTRLGRRGFKLAWWTLTLQLPRKLAARRAMIAAHAFALSNPPAPAVIEPAPTTPLVPAATPGGEAREHSGRNLLSASLPGPARPRIVFVSGEAHTPGHLYRVERYAQAASKSGADVLVTSIEDAHLSLDTIKAAQIVILWRAVWGESVAAVVTAARAGGAKLAFDVDDLIFEPELATVKYIDGIRTHGLTEDAVSDFYARVRTTLLHCDCAIAPTEFLAQRLRLLQHVSVVHPNGFDQGTFLKSRLSVRARRQADGDGLTRIGYASGSKTHQKDFAQAAAAVARVLRERPDCRLVLFRHNQWEFVDVGEFPELDGLGDQIEWRAHTSLQELPGEIARFDVNLAPLEADNPFCEAKSELKYFEGALAGVPTIASPTAVFAAAIRPGETGLLANSEEEWYVAMRTLIDDPAKRQRMAQNALIDVLPVYGPERRAERMASFIDMLLDKGQRAARTFELDIKRAASARPPLPAIVPHRVIFERDRLGSALITVIVPLFNYAGVLVETLESIKAQTLECLDLIVIDDSSTDSSLEVARAWITGNAERFNRVLLLQNEGNSKLASTRNVGLFNAETPFVVPLDADNLLLPYYAENLLRAIDTGNAAFAYSVVKEFGGEDGLTGLDEFDPALLASGNFVDVICLTRKSAWAAAGGYDDVPEGIPRGWEDYDLWLKFVERGLYGVQVPRVLAGYRVHQNSMLRTETEIVENKTRLLAHLSAKHPWIRLPNLPSSEPAPAEEVSRPDAALSDNIIAIPHIVGAGLAEQYSRLEKILPALICPETGEKLEIIDPTTLRSIVSHRQWPIVQGRPHLFRSLGQPRIYPDEHLSNIVPERADALIRATRGRVLNLSAGGTRLRYDHVIEAEAGVFRNTDVIADAHSLPFADETFELVFAMNAFEHYHSPETVAKEIERVLRPGGQVLIRTAFLQPLHEAPLHFYNCTRYGLEKWFSSFKTLDLYVSENFNPAYAVSWLLSETEFALGEVSPEAAATFGAARCGDVMRFWRDVNGRNGELWSNFQRIPAARQESIAAGFEYLGRKPER